MFPKRIIPIMFLCAAGGVCGCTGNSPKTEAPPAPQPENLKVQTTETAWAQKVEEADTIIPKKNAPVVKKRPSAPSLTGYIARNGAFLQSEPLPDAPQTGSFKIYEQVVILETKMTDENENVSDYPVWYKVQCADKKIGWVSARFVTVN